MIAEKSLFTHNPAVTSVNPLGLYRECSGQDGVGDSVQPKARALTIESVDRSRRLIYVF